MKVSKKSIPVNCLRLEARALPESFDEKSNTIEVIWGNQASRVTRWGWDIGYYIEQLSFDPAHVDMKRFISKAANFLKDHDALVDSVIGVIESAYLKDGQGFATIRLSEKESSKELVADMKAGILKNISVGYFPKKMELLESVEGQMPVYLVTNWEPAEISLVAVPADPDARTRGQEKHSGHECEVIQKQNKSPEGKEKRKMDELEKQKLEQERAAAVKKAAEDATAAATAAERLRGSEILKMTKTAGLEESFAQDLIKKGTELSAAKDLILDAWAAKGEKTPAKQKIERTEHDETAARRKGIEAALTKKIDPKSVLADEGREYAGMTLIEMAKECIGKDARGLHKNEVARRSLSSSDFPLILENIATKSLQKGYADEVASFSPFVSQGTLPDYKEASRVKLGVFSNLAEVEEGAEFTDGTVGEDAERISLAKYGKILRLTEETLINDDMSAFGKLPKLFGAAAKRTEADLVYAVLTATHLMSDGVTLFDSSAHGNVGTTAALSITTIAELEKKMLQQRVGSQYIAPKAKFLVVGPTNKVLAQQITGSISPNASTSFNPYVNAFQVIIDPRITTNAHYLIADPAVIDTIELAFLEGLSGPEIVAERDFDTGGHKWRVKHVVGVKALEWRSMAKNVGA